MTAPAASSACTDTYGPSGAGGREIAVSNPLRGASAIVVRPLGSPPPSTLQRATRVAPFQLAYTLRPPWAPRAAAKFGAWAPLPPPPAVGAPCRRQVRGVGGAARPGEAVVPVGLVSGPEVGLQERFSGGAQLGEVPHLTPAEKPVAVRQRLHAALAFGHHRGGL